MRLAVLGFLWLGRKDSNLQPSDQKSDELSRRTHLLDERFERFVQNLCSTTAVVSGLPPPLSRFLNSKSGRGPGI